MKRKIKIYIKDLYREHNLLYDVVFDSYIDFNNDDKTNLSITYIFKNKMRTFHIEKSNLLNIEFQNKDEINVYVKEKFKLKYA